MHEPPSHELVRQLTELQLCHPNDLRRARGRVRRLSFDLPAFDSVWIDSLVQLRLLTPYQARLLEQGQAEQLRIGPFVVIDELGRGPQGNTFLAQQLHRRDRRILKGFKLEPQRAGEVCHQMKRLLEQAKGFAHPHLVLPSEILTPNDNELVTVSRYVPGLPLNELLVRRGRFPATVVLEIARQLLEGLSALHAKSLVHGDIRMSNVRLTDNGLAVLVDGGIRQIVHPEITIHDTMALEAYDAIAPELIGTGEAPTASSELYSLGCLLWQLLAGRPPFTTADPLAKLASHQTLTIDDVRKWAPDTPAVLANTIRQLTSPTPDQRPRGFNEVIHRLGKPGSFSRSRLKQFRRLFEGGVPHFSRPISGGNISSRIWITALIFATTGVAALLYDSGMRNVLLEIVDNAKTFAQTRATSDQKPSHDAARATPENSNRSIEKHRGLRSLPPPVDGLILLGESGSYEAASLTFKGDLTIRSGVGVKAEIHVDEAPFRLAALSILLDGVTVRRANDSKLGRLVSIQSQRLTIRNCEFLTFSKSSQAGDKSDGIARETVSIAWQPLANRNSESESIVIENSVYHGAGAAFWMAQTPRTLRISNTLKTGRGAFVSLGRKCLTMEFHLKLDRVTLRETGPLLTLAGEPASKTGAPPIQIEATNCVFQLANPESGLILIDGESPRTDLAKSILVNDASNSVIAPDTALLKVLDLEHNSFTAVLGGEDDDEQFEGLVQGEIKFAGKELHNPAHAKTNGIIGPPGTDDALPGMDPQQLGPTHRPNSPNE